MTDFLQSGIEWLESQRTAHLTQSVTYVRGGSSLEILATIGKTEYVTDSEHVVAESFESRDFIVSAADLVIGDADVTPEVGDQVQEIAGSNRFIYEVVPMGPNPCWRYSDDFRKAVRIHTKLVKVEAI